MARSCPFCGAPLNADARACEYCGTALPNTSRSTSDQSASLHAESPYAESPYAESPYTTNTNTNTNTNSSLPVKNKLVAGLLALLLGGIGIHKFYLGQTGKGILYILFCWTYIPGLLAFIEGLMILCGSDEKFMQKYNCRIG